jgi:hypothetical protein
MLKDPPQIKVSNFPKSLTWYCGVQVPGSIRVCLLHPALQTQSPTPASHIFHVTGEEHAGSG